MVKDKPGTIGCAASGIGTYGHLAGELITQAAAAPMVHIPYKGTGAAIAGFVAGHVPVMIAGEPCDLTKDGGVRILATTNQTRPPDSPNVPTMKELGCPQFVADSWIGLFAPAGMDPAIATKLRGLGEQHFANTRIVPLKTPEAMGTVAAGRVAQGFGFLKIKLSGDAALDLAHVRAVRQAAGPQVRLMADANESCEPKAADPPGARPAALRHRADRAAHARP